MSIRFKVILPYLLLTLLVAVTGAYVVTRLVANSLEERLSNQLLEAGRVVSDSMARRELDHIQDARLVAFTSGMGAALRDGNEAGVMLLAKPAAAGLSAENLMVFDAGGREILHTIRQPNGEIMDVTRQGEAADLSIVDDLITENNPDGLPKRTLAPDPVDGRQYYFTAIPATFEDRVVGIVVAGTSLDTIVPFLKANASADVVIYEAGGQALASTLGSPADPLFLRTLSIDDAFYARVIDQDDSVEGENFEVEGRYYRTGFSPLKISDDRVAVFAVVLPMQFVVESSSTNRDNYVILYSAAMLAVILVGYLIARIIIINPLSSLVRTSRAIADGDLNKRTGLKTNDEIGVLASTFDVMTDNLQQRTVELEKTNRVLEQMDRTKIRFIQVSAHELRTPLTLVQGYAQMIQMKSRDNKDLAKYARGIMDGSTRMVDIIDNLLDVSRIDSNLLDVKATDVEIAGLIERAEITFKESLQERDMTLVTEGLADLPPVKADTDLLYKVFYHVIGNAIKYTPDGGSITVSGCTVTERNQKPEIEIKVRDTGIGIDPQYHELVFEKFYQTGEVLLHSSGKTKFKGGGPGLGLAIARGIMDAHRGRIWLTSAGYNEETHPGTTVFIRLPADGNK